jgi:hypothetical protein
MVTKPANGESLLEARRRLDADARGLTRDRLPGSVDEARTLIAYNERILASTVSGQRRVRAERMIANLRPHLERLERDEAERLARIQRAAPPASSFEGSLQRWRDARDTGDVELEVVWNGGEGLTSMGERRAQ